MKTMLWAAIAAAGLLAATAASAADQYVHGYTRANGTYVQGYHRSAPNNTTLDNYSTRGNINPYTGAVGTRDPSYTPPTYQPAYQPAYTPPVYQPTYEEPQQSADDGCDDPNGCR